MATLRPSYDPRHAAQITPLLCMLCGDQGTADVAANLLLFLPFATGLRLAGWSWRRTVAAALLVSFTVELLQLLVVPGRDASLSDVVTNTTSGAMGATLGGLLPGLAAPPPVRAMRLLAGSLLAPLALLGVWAWLLGPDMPPGRLVSRWAVPSPSFDTFRGRVTAVRLNGREMPTDGIPADARRLRQQIAAGGIDLDVEVVSATAEDVSATPIVTPAWIYMFRVRSRGAVTLGQLERLAVFAVPTRSFRYGFFQPSLALMEGLPAESGVPVVLRASEHGPRLVLSSTYAGRTRTTSLGITPAYGWTLISPFQFGGWERWLTALCLVFLYAPAGYWAAATGRPARALAGLAAGIGLALVGLAPLGGLAASPWTEWLGALAGVTLGWAVRRAAAYLETPCVSPSASEFFSP